MAIYITLIFCFTGQFLFPPGLVIDPIYPTAGIQMLTLHLKHWIIQLQDAVINIVAAGHCQGQPGKMRLDGGLHHHPLWTHIITGQAGGGNDYVRSTGECKIFVNRFNSLDAAHSYLDDLTDCTLVG